ncbi:hypothetical protein WJX84_011824 [Apatococcus fuscideae]|uniref:SAP domain-containing protein n=1 Tax=Apatococcus fuscideae TaxID=2026836 RepID=A0AAW1T8U2_9CHLO
MTSSGVAIDFKKLKVQELRDELKKRDLDTTGIKSVLLARLEEACQAEDLAAADESKPEPEATTETAAAPAEVAEAAPDLEDPTLEAAAEAAAAPQETEAEKAKRRAERFGGVAVAAIQGNKKPPAEIITAAASNGKAARTSAVAKAVEADPEEVARRKDRAKRFGMPIPIVASEEQDKRKARAARFEMPGSTTTVEMKTKLDQRKEHFKTAGPAATNGKGNGPEAIKLDARAKRFGSGSIDSAELDAKKKARAERFAAS